jgi:hypothetical protein
VGESPPGDAQVASIELDQGTVKAALQKP